METIACGAQVYQQHINNGSIIILLSLKVIFSAMSYPFHSKIFAQNGSSTVAQAHFVGCAQFVYLGDSLGRRAVDRLQHQHRRDRGCCVSRGC